MRISSFALAVLICLAASCTASATPLQVYIIAGQSNAAGGGRIADLPPSDAALGQPQASIYQYDNNGSVTTDWQPLAAIPGGGIHAYFGAELSFAQAMERRTGQPIAVIKAAYNGSGLASRWMPSLNDLYPLMIDKVQSSLAQLTQSYELAGMLWIQGENDAGVLQRAEAYDDNLITLANAVRTDLNAPAMPFLFNELHVDVNRVFRHELRASQHNAANEGTNMFLVNADDLPLLSDWVHFTAEMHAELGRRFADVLSPSGDYNNDGAIGGNDLAIWKSSFGVDRHGDGNADGISDGADFLLWQRQVSSVPSATTIPEPTSLVVAGAAAFCLAAFNAGPRRKNARRC